MSENNGLNTLILIFQLNQAGIFIFVYLFNFLSFFLILNIEL